MLRTTEATSQLLLTACDSLRDAFTLLATPDTPRPPSLAQFRQNGIFVEAKVDFFVRQEMQKGLIGEAEVARVTEEIKGAYTRFLAEHSPPSEELLKRIRKTLEEDHDHFFDNKYEIKLASENPELARRAKAHQDLFDRIDDEDNLGNLVQVNVTLRAVKREQNLLQTSSKKKVKARALSVGRIPKWKALTRVEEESSLTKGEAEQWRVEGTMSERKRRLYQI